MRRMWTSFKLWAREVLECYSRTIFWQEFGRPGRQCKCDQRRPSSWGFRGEQELYWELDTHTCFIIMKELCITCCYWLILVSCQPREFKSNTRFSGTGVCEPYPCYTENGDDDEEGSNTMNLRDKTDLTRGARLTEVTDCLFSSHI